MTPPSSRRSCPPEPSRCATCSPGVHHQQARRHRARTDGGSTCSGSDLHRRRCLRRLRGRDAPRWSTRLAAGSGGGAARWGHHLVHRRAHARREWSSRLTASPAARGRRGVDRRPRLPPRRAHRHPHPLPPRLHGRRGQTHPRRQAARPPGDRGSRPHHFTLTDAACDLRSVFQVHPPLALSAADVAAVKTGLADAGTIDAIATDHAPHAVRDKGTSLRGSTTGDARPRDRAGGRPDRLVEPGVLSLADAIGLLLVAPGGPRRPRRRRRPDRAGRCAHLCVLDPRRPESRPAPAGQPRTQNTLRDAP